MRIVLLARAAVKMRAGMVAWGFALGRDPEKSVDDLVRLAAIERARRWKALVEENPELERIAGNLPPIVQWWLWFRPEVWRP